MAYTAQTWIDSNTSYPLSAARMTNMENGIVGAATIADQGHRILTTAQRDGLASVTTGTVIYNTTTGQTELYNGSAWVAEFVPGAWTSYTPTLTNCTSPITYARYMKSGRTVVFSVVLTLTGAQVSGLIGISLPVTAAQQFGGDFSAMLLGATFYVGVPYMGTTSRIDLYAANASATYTSMTATSSTIPFTWASTHQIVVGGSYEAAS